MNCVCVAFLSNCVFKITGDNHELNTQGFINKSDSPTLWFQDTHVDPATVIIIII